MNQFISPIAIQSFCDFFASLASILFNFGGIIGAFLTPLAGVGQLVLPSANQLIADICFVAVANATGAAS